VLDIDAKRFDDEFYAFRVSIKELERRLGSVLNQGFEDCGTIFDAFKLIESFEGLLEREFIQVRAARTACARARHACASRMRVSHARHARASRMRVTRQARA